jgi:hypothetical protein
MSELPPGSVTLEQVNELREQLNSLRPDALDAVLGREGRIATLKRWLSEPACFQDPTARAAAKELVKWFS